MFTCKLTRYDEIPGFYTFGHLEPEETADQPFYVPIIDDSGFWKIYSCSVIIDGVKTSRPKNTAIADTGTTLCLVDKATCEAIYAKIPGSKYDAASEGYIFPDNIDHDKLPAIEIGIGDPDIPGGEKTFSIYPRDLIFSAASQGWIYGGIQDRGSQGFDILGDVFLKNLYAVDFSLSGSDSRFGNTRTRGLGLFSAKLDLSTQLTRRQLPVVKCG